MEFLKTLLDIFLHLDDYLSQLIALTGGWTYLILFGVVFAETGLVVTPFLPGDSLLFAAGAFAAKGDLNVSLLVVVFTTAAILGDSVNYAIGHRIGPRAFGGSIRFLKKDHLEKTQAFYEKHGGKTIILARFVPIVRTFAPFVAGVGTMNYSKFILFNVIGAILWVPLFTFAGFFFGNLPIVVQNFEIVILAIIFISLLPAVFEYVKDRRQARKILALPE